MGRKLKAGSMREAINSIYTVLIRDEELMRLLYYKPENKTKGYRHPNSNCLPDIVPESQLNHNTKPNIKPRCDKFKVNETDCVSSEFMTEDEQIERYWDIVDERVITATKSSDIEEKTICRIYIYAGRRRSKFGNYLLVNQEIVVDVFVHESYSGDLRVEWICDRINELLVHEREYAGYGGQIEYAAGNPRVAPIGYTHYENIYVYGEKKK